MLPASPSSAGLQNGHWALVYNDTEEGRHSLAVAISDDEGRTWRWRRHLEAEAPAEAGGAAAGEFHYPSIIQARDGTLHVSYSFFAREADAAKDAEGRLLRKAIKHAHFNEAWVIEGDRAAGE